VGTRKTPQEGRSVEGVQRTGDEGSESDPDVSEQVVDRIGLGSNAVPGGAGECSLFERSQGTDVGPPCHDSAKQERKEKDGGVCQVDPEKDSIVR